MSGGASQHARNDGLGLRRLWQRIQEGPYPPGWITQSRPLADPAFQAGHSQHNLAVAPRLVEGVITDATSVANCYRVQLEGLRAPITATLGGLGATGASGARSLVTLPMGTKVHVLWHPNTYYGVIIGAIPYPQLSGAKAITGHLFHTSRARVDSAHLLPFKLSGGYITDWLAGRPYDATNAGEQGFIAETGMRVLCDSFMSMLGLDEAASLSVFYHDQLVRLGAYNFRMFTAGSEREALNDLAECNDWTGWTPYPWEQLGLFNPGDPRRELSPATWQLEEPHYGNWEPRDDRQRPWHRELEFHGYLGQGGKRIVQAPPQDASAEFAVYGDDLVFPTLASQSTGLDGRTVFASAKGIALVKRLALPGPSRRLVPEELDGDSAENYRPGGREAAGSGPPHTIVGDITVNGNPSLSKAAGVLDLHAYWFNYASNHPFFYHAKDWTLPDEASLTYAQATPPSFGALASQMFLPAPDPTTLRIDHRYEEVEYFANESGIELLDDGGVLIYDGFGASLLMTLGQIYLDAPGDIWTRAGRNAVTWGGRDVIVRAKNSMDLTCTEGDQRFKAEKNWHVLAGNGETGGVLLESRAPSVYEFEGKQGEDVRSGGIMLRATQGDVVSWSRQLYLRTGGGDIAAGPIVLDADKGRQSVVVHGRGVQHFVRDGLYINFGAEGEVEETTLFTQSISGIASQLLIDDDVLLAGNLLMDGSIFVASGHIATEQAANGAIFVAPLADDALQSARDAAALARTTLNNTMPGVTAGLYDALMEARHYASSGAGNDTVIRNAEFSLRSVAQYKTEGFELPEARWQQLARVVGGGATWQERPVACRLDSQAHPYPGRENFTSDTMSTQDLALHDVNTGLAVSHGTRPELVSDYLRPRYKARTMQSLNSYRVVG